MKRSRELRGVLAAASLLVTAGVLAVASVTHAEGHLGSGVGANKPKPCNRSTPCLTETNAGSGGGVRAKSSSGNALEGDATTGQGVYGSSTGTASATVGSNSSTGNGIYGYSFGGDGVQGQSHNGIAVDGYSTNGYGVYGQSGATETAGVYGYSNANVGMGVAAVAGPDAFMALLTKGPTTDDSADNIIASDASGNYVFTVDDRGNVEANAYYDAGFCKNGCSKSRHVVSYAAETSEPTLDNVGEATLRAGSAHVAIDAAFANVVDATKSYVVLLTPEGDADSLYVSNRSASGFDVRESHGGRSSIGFAYRIVAHPYGKADRRLPFVTRKPIRLAQPRSHAPLHAGAP